MGLLLSVLAFVFVLWCGRKSLGHGLGATLGVGFFYGLCRALYPDGYSHFIFDCAVLALYASRFIGSVPGQEATRGRWARMWLWVLGGWALFIIPLVSLLPRPTQPFLIQLVGLRAIFLFLPVVVLGSRLTPGDLIQLQRWSIFLTAIAFAFALFELKFGIERIYPVNEVTELIYRSNDIGPERHYRIPATFSSAHAYAGTMLALLPILLAQASTKKWQVLRWSAVALAALGIFVSGARSPVVQVGLIIGLLLVTARLRLRWVLGLSAVAVCVGYIVWNTPRFQRFETLQDTEAVEERIGSSLNKTLWDVISEYPMGAGPGSAEGTSIPFFLARDALPQIGLENEYGRIALEQGIIGLLLWIAFLCYCLMRRPKAAFGFDSLSLRMMWSYTLVAWGTAFIGTGILTSIPSVLLLMTQMGLVCEAAWSRSGHFVESPLASLGSPTLRVDGM